MFLHTHTHTLLVLVNRSPTFLLPIPPACGTTSHPFSEHMCFSILFPFKARPLSISWALSGFLTSINTPNWTHKSKNSELRTSICNVCCSGPGLIFSSSAPFLEISWFHFSYIWLKFRCGYAPHFYYLYKLIDTLADSVF